MTPNTAWVIWNFEQGEGLFDLFRIAQSALDFKDKNLQVDLNGIVYPYSADRLIENTQADGGNSVDIYGARPNTTTEQEASERCQIRISPENRFWCAQHFGKRKEAETVTRNNEALASWVRSNGIRYPNILSIGMKLDSAGLPNLSQLRSRMIKALNRAAVERPVRGFADLKAAAIEFPMNLASQPWTISQLQQRFDRLHVLMLSSLQEMRELGELLRTIEPAVEIDSCNSGGMELGIVTLAGALANTNSVPAGVKQFFIDSSTSEPGFGAAEEFSRAVQVGSVHRFTKRIYEDRLRTGLAAKIRDGWTLHSVISSRYCIELGIDPEDMLVELMNAQLSRNIQLEVDQRLSSTHGPLTAASILNCHFEVYERYLVDDTYRKELRRVIENKYIVFFSQSGRA